MSLEPRDDLLQRSFHASAFLRDLADAARDYPVPAALIGIGALWLFSRASREVGAHAIRPFVDAATATTDAATTRAQSSPIAPAESVGGLAEIAGQKIADLAWPRRGVNDLWDAQPLVAGAAGLAVGAALATLFPTTAIETEMLGPHAERLAAQAKGSLPKLRKVGI
jgi:hypothetical protein